MPTVIVVFVVTVVVVVVGLDDVDLAVAEVADQEVAGDPSPAHRRHRESPRRVERAPSGHARDQATVRGVLVDGPEPLTDRIAAGRRVDLGVRDVYVITERLDA